jgi:vacuolar-type H+-ATPase subunit I/STV1
MSSVSKTATLRIIVPKILAQRATTSLEPFGRVDAEERVLNTGRLTIEDAVRYIKEYAKLRDGFSLTLRQIGIARKPESATPEVADLTAVYSEAETEVAEARGEYQKLLSNVEASERQIQEVEKQISTVEQLKTTGFSFDEMMSRATGFRRILGRLPLKKLDAAQKALNAVLKERAIMTTGAKRNGSIYLLVATPIENGSQVLQTLLLYDFVPTDIPSVEGTDMGEALTSWQKKKDLLAEEKQSFSRKLEVLQESLTGPLNRSADQIEETLLLLRGSLRLGEGTKAAHLIARLDKPPTPIVLNALQSDGVIELD